MASESREERRRNMQAITSKNTAIEVLIRKSIFKRGFRYRIHSKQLPGTPDIVLPKYRAVIFVNGCFWHGHDCGLFRQPKSNSEYWKEKIDRNRLRDSNNISRLVSMRWRVITVWECSLRGKGATGLTAVTDSIVEWLKSGEQIGEVRGLSLD